MGKDNISNELLKNEKVIQLLQKLFSMCLTSGMIPDVWRTSILHPIPKTDPKSIDPLMYRGLALQCCTYKILSSIINSRVSSHLENGNYILDEQNGFHPGCSCLHHIFVANTLIKRCVRGGQSVYVAFLDFWKAFNFVDREMMIFRLQQYHIDGNLLKLIKEIYTDTTNVLRLNGEFGEYFTSEKGTCQGDNQSPTYFNCFINELLKELKGQNVGIQVGNELVNNLAYADDIVLFATSPDDLQLLLDCVSSWCKRWQVVVNTSKTKLMHFHKKSTPPDKHQLRLDGIVLERVSNYKYLGVLMNEYCEQSPNIENLATAASGRWAAY